MKKLKAYNVTDMRESIHLIYKIAYDYKHDVDNIKITGFKELYRYAQSKYKKEKGEIFRRPDIFIKFGGDCDCQSIFIIAMMEKFKVPRENVELQVCGKEKYSHIFPIITMHGEKYYFDMLPERIFNQRKDYNLIKIFNYYT